MFKRVQIILVGLLFTSMIHPMKKDGSNQEEFSGAQKKVATLKQSCFNGFIALDPEKAKRLLLDKRAIPTELIEDFGCEVAKNASEEYITFIAEILPEKSYPDMALKVITERKRDDIDGKKRILSALLKNLNHNKEDDPFQKVTLGYKVIERMRDVYDGSSDQTGQMLFTSSFLDADDVSIFQFLLSKREFKKNKIERLLNVPQYTEDWVFGEGKFSRWVSFFEKNMTEEQIKSLQMVEIDGLRKTKFFLSLKAVYSLLVLKIHKLLYLGFRPSPEGFYFLAGKDYNAKTETFDKNTYFKKKISCIDLILYSLYHLQNNESRDFDYALMKFRLDDDDYQLDNARFAEQIANFYKDNSQNSKVRCIGTHITDERYCNDLDFFGRTLELKTNFYLGALKLLLPYYKEEFEKKKVHFSQLLSKPLEGVEEFICSNPFYDPALYEAKWSL